MPNTSWDLVSTYKNNMNIVYRPSNFFKPTFESVSDAKLTKDGQPVYNHFEGAVLEMIERYRKDRVKDMMWRFD